MFYFLKTKKIFDDIRAINKEILNKIHLIKGDVAVDGLNLEQSDEDELLLNTNLIFHAAANTSFLQTLREAVNFNTIGTLRMLKLAEKMRNLVNFTYVSTAFSQCNEHLDEKYYAAVYNPYGIIEMTSLLKDEGILTDMTPKYYLNASL